MTRKLLISRFLKKELNWVWLNVTQAEYDALQEELHPVERFANKEGKMLLPIAGYPQVEWPVLEVEI